MMNDGYVVVNAGWMLARRKKTRTQEMVTDAGGFHWTMDVQAARVFRDRGSAWAASEIAGGSVKRIVNGRIL